MHKQHIQIISGQAVYFIKAAMWINIAAIAISESSSIRQVYKLIQSILFEKRVIYGDRVITKLVKSPQGYQFGLNVPPWPSKAFNKFFRFTINKIQSSQKIVPGSARMVLMGITKKCPLNCEHCYEWNEINKKEVMTEQFLVDTIGKYSGLGASLFWLGGGEPLSRFDSIKAILAHAPEDISVWLSTSGYGLNFDKALQLRKLGLTGIIVSLDHFHEKQHNAFRGNSKSFHKAVEAVRVGIDAGLVVGLSLCTTKALCNANFIHQYMDFAQRLGVGFVQWLEPRAAGKYEGKDVELTDEDFQLLDHHFFKYSFDPKFKNYPAISHPGYPQRIVGCGAAGVFNVYVDTDGHTHACPFCRTKQLTDLPTIGNCEKYPEKQFKNDVAII
jgi:MoaA/NifB/PqqE/SkfB family radical SAM enzyme